MILTYLSYRYLRKSTKPISSIVGTNDECILKLNDDVDTHSVLNYYFDFLRGDDYMQAVVADLTGFFDEELLQRVVTERGANSK